MIGAGIDLGYSVGDDVEFEGYPDFVYQVDQILDGGETVLVNDGDDYSFALPGPLLRKVDDDDE
jgi:hypothetical protein